MSRLTCNGGVGARRLIDDAIEAKRRPLELISAVSGEHER